MYTFIKIELRKIEKEIMAGKIDFNRKQRNGGGHSILPLRAIQNRFRSIHIAASIFRKRMGAFNSDSMWAINKNDTKWIIQEIEKYKIETSHGKNTWDQTFITSLICETLKKLINPTFHIKSELVLRRLDLIKEKALFKENQRTNTFACYDQVEADKNGYRALHVAYTICKKNNFNLGDNNIYYPKEDWIISQIKKYKIETPNKNGLYKDYFNYDLCSTFMIKIQNGEI